MPTWETWFNADDIRDASEELHCYAISERSLKLCLALLDLVNYAYRYDGAVTDDEIDGWQADLAFQLMGEAADCAPEIGDDEDCILYMPDALFIDYAPNDPFQTPDLVPPGYLFVPPWYTNPLIPLPGVLPTDAMVNFAALSVFGDLGGAVTSGLPRFHLDIDGEGEVELEFVKVPQGGNVIVIQDGDPLQQQVYDLNALELGELGTLEDLFDIVVAESLNDTSVCEVRFTTPGLHTIDVTFFPNIAADVIVGMGGGLRRVSLCGVAPEAEVSMPQFQAVGCLLQWRPNSSAAWATLVDLCALQPPTIVRQDQTPPGNMEQKIGTAAYTEIANTDFVWRNGAHPMTGGLEISSTEDSPQITINRGAAPNTNKDMILMTNSAGAMLAKFDRGGGYFWDSDIAGGAMMIMRAPAEMGTTPIWRTTWKLWNSKKHGMLQGSNQRPTLIVPTDNTIPLVVAGVAITHSVRLTEWYRGLIDAAAAAAWVDYDGSINLHEILGFQSQTSLQQRLAADISGFWSVTTDAIRQGALVVSVLDAAAPREAVRYRSDGTAAMIGEYGHAPALQQHVIGETFNIPALNSLLAALAASGRIVDETTSDFVIPEPEVPPETDTWCLYYDFTDHESWELDTTYAADHIGQYVAATGWADEDSDPAPAQVVIRKDFGIPYVITAIEITFTFFTSTPEPPPLEPYAGIRFGSIDALYKEEFYSAGGSYTLLHTATINTRYLQINITDNSFGVIHLTSAKIFGAGLMPDDPTADTCP